MQLVIECRLCFCPLFYFYYIFSTLRHLSLFDQFYFIKKCSYNYAVGNTQYLNISTTPLWQWGFWQCLPFSWTTLRGKHCRHPIAVMGVVDTFGKYTLLVPKLLVFIDHTIALTVYHWQIIRYNRCLDHLTFDMKLYMRITCDVGPVTT